MPVLSVITLATPNAARLRKYKSGQNKLQPYWGQMKFVLTTATLERKKDKAYLGDGRKSKKSFNVLLTQANKLPITMVATERRMTMGCQMWCNGANVLNSIVMKINANGPSK